MSSATGRGYSYWSSRTLVWRSSSARSRAWRGVQASSTWAMPLRSSSFWLAVPPNSRKSATRACAANPWHDERPFSEGLDYALHGDGATLIFMALAVVTILIGIILFFKWRKISLTVTDKRVYGSNSSGKRVDLPLDAVSAISLVKKSAVAVTTASGAIKFGFLKNAEEVHATVSDLLIQRQSQPRGAAPAVSADAADQLKKFKALLDDGVITQAEFEEKKKALLK